MKPALYERNYHTLKDLETGERKALKSANAAKRASRKIQIEADGALGLGSVRVVGR